MCNKAVCFAKDSGRVRRLPQILYNLSWALAKRGRECDVERAKQAIKEAFCLYYIMENRPDFLERLRKFSMDNFGEELPEI